MSQPQQFTQQQPGSPSYYQQPQTITSQPQLAQQPGSPSYYPQDIEQPGNPRQPYNVQHTYSVVEVQPDYNQARIQAGPSTVVPYEAVPVQGVEPPKADTDTMQPPAETEGQNNRGTRPSSFSGCAWLGCILFFPLGLIAVHCAGKVDREWETGNFEAAREASGCTLCCSRLAIKAGILLIFGIFGAYEAYNAQ